jgi:hypothetical protein
MPRAAQSYRFGGEATLPSVIVAQARDAFLYAVDELYPQVLHELLELAAHAGMPNLAASTPGDFAEWLVVPEVAPAGWPALLEAIEAWARRWRLLDRGRIPRWLLEAALSAISRHHAHGWRWWSIGWAGAVPDSCEVLPPIPLTPELERALPAGLWRILIVCSRLDGGKFIECRFHPEIDGAGRFKRALRKYAHSVLRVWHVSAEQVCRRIDETVAAALAHGCVPGQWRAERRIVYWAARAVVGREAYEDIANDPNRGVSERRERLSPPTVRNQVGEFLVLIGLRRRSGRKDR